MALERETLDWNELLKELTSFWMGKKGIFKN